MDFQKVKAIKKKCEITLQGQVISKKNSKRIVMSGKYPKLLSSKQFIAWNAEAEEQLGPELGRIYKEMEHIHAPYWVKIDLGMENKRRRDISNLAESVMDLLVNMEIIEDDEFKVVERLSLKYHYGPETYITIHEV